LWAARDTEVDAPVERSPARCVVGGDRALITKAPRYKALRLNPEADHVGAHRLSARLGELLVKGLAPGVIGVALHAQLLNLWVALEERGDLLQDREALAEQLALVVLKEHALVDLKQLTLLGMLVAGGCRALIGAAVFIEVLVERLGLHHTLVKRVDDSVVVVVGVGAAVAVLKAIFVFGEQRATVEVVEDAVFVLVAHRRRRATARHRWLVGGGAPGELREEPHLHAAVVVVEAKAPAEAHAEQLRVLSLRAGAQGEQELIRRAVKIKPTLAVLTDHLKALVGCVACRHAKRRAT
jgi:hypothetical protein